MDITDVPRFDPKRHGDDDFVVVELAASDGSLFRRADPLAVIRPDAEEWVARARDLGLAPVSAAEAVATRSGGVPEPGTEGAVDHTDRKVRSWAPFETADTASAQED